jgi:hypothetical protein
MGAWQLRAIVYGLLAVVSALVLWQSGALAGEPPVPQTLHGHTAQGSRIAMTVQDGDVIAFDTGHIAGDCGSPYEPWGVWRWYPATRQANVSYTRDGHSFAVHEWPDPRFGDGMRWHVNLYMRASFDASGAVAGRVWFTAEPGGRHCESRRIAFSAGP